MQVPLAALRQPRAAMAATVALARPRQFLEAASLMLAAVAVAVRAAPEVLVGQAAVAMAEPKVQPFKPLTARLILAAVVVVLGLEALLLLALAAQALSFSSTTSARPQSSPSSHRKSGLHQRVR